MHPFGMIRKNTTAFDRHIVAYIEGREGPRGERLVGKRPEALGRREIGRGRRYTAARDALRNMEVRAGLPACPIQTQHAVGAFSCSHLPWAPAARRVVRVADAHPHTPSIHAERPQTGAGTQRPFGAHMGVRPRRCASLAHLLWDARAACPSRRWRAAAVEPACWTPSTSDPPILALLISPHEPIWQESRVSRRWCAGCAPSPPARGCVHGLVRRASSSVKRVPATLLRCLPSDVWCAFPSLLVSTISPGLI
jgi:hypothetical protein